MRLDKPWLAAVLLFCAAPCLAGERTIPELYQPGDRSAWILQIDGQRIGEHAFRYAGALDLAGSRAHHFVSSVRIDPVPALPTEQRLRGELWTDDQGHLLRHLLEISVGSSYTRIDMVQGEDAAAVHIRQDFTTQEVEVPAPDGSFIQANNFVGYFELLLALAPPAAGEAKSYPLLSANVLKPFPYNVTHVGVYPEKAVEGVASGVVLEDSLGEQIHLSAQGRIELLTQAASKLLVERTDQEVAEVEIEAPDLDGTDDRFDSEEVVIRHGEVALAGTITRRSDADGRLPAVFFVSGSGGQDRQGRANGVDVGTHEILDRLTEEGFLVLRIDDRGVGESKGPTDGLGYTDLVADARACVEHLLGRADVDPTRVCVIGHSEGGLTAPILATEIKEIAAIVLMAPLGRPLPEVILEQNDRALDETGVSGADKEKALAEVKRWLDLLAGSDPLEPADIPAEFHSILNNRRWLQEHAARDPVQIIRQVSCPVLLLHGDKDFQVHFERDSGLLAAALEEAGHKDHELKVFEGLDHLFKETPGEESQLADYFQIRPVDEEFLDFLAEWLGKRLLDG